MVDWTRQSLGIFSHFKWWPHGWWGKKAHQHKELHSWKLAKAQKSKSAFHLPPEWVLPSDGIQLLCEQTGANWAGDNEELWPGLRAISLSSTCRQRERRHWAAEHTSTLPCFSQNDSSTENVNLCLPKHQSQEGCEKKQVSSALEKVHDKHFPIISNSIWFLKRGRKLKISQHMWQPVLLQKCVWTHFQLRFIATPKDEKQTCVCVWFRCKAMYK